MPLVTITGDLEKALRIEVDELIALDIAQQKSAKILHEEILDNIRQVGAIASGDLLRSITTSIFKVSATETLIGSGSTASYAEFVERGRRPGKQPPSDVIYKWMVDKGLEPSQSGAYLIARSIGRRGIPGKFPFEKAFNTAAPRIQAIVITALNEGFR